MSEMPAAPSGMVWVLHLNPLYDDATLWLYKKSIWTGGPSITSVKCRGLRAPDWPTHASLSPQKASIEEFVEATVAAAQDLIRDVSGEPEREAAYKAKAAELSRRLGIKIEVKR